MKLPTDFVLLQRSDLAYLRFENTRLTTQLAAAEGVVGAARIIGNRQCEVYDFYEGDDVDLPPNKRDLCLDPNNCEMSLLPEGQSLQRCDSCAMFASLATYDRTLGGERDAKDDASLHRAERDGVSGVDAVLHREVRRAE